MIWNRFVAVCPMVVLYNKSVSSDTAVTAKLILTVNPRRLLPMMLPSLRVAYILPPSLSLSSWHLPAR